MNNFFENLNESSNAHKKWISIRSDLESLDGQKKEIDIELMKDGKPRAMAFFDIDGTLAHLSAIHSKAIQKLFPQENPIELEQTYYGGFKLGNSFREFDRMRGIYIDGHKEWKDAEFYFKNRYIPNSKEIDQPGNRAHENATLLLKQYGDVAASVCDELFKNNKEEFEKSKISSIFLLANMYSRLGIPMVGFTANAKIFVDKLAKYLSLSDIFLDIATDETMAGGGKEVAIHYLINKLENKGIPIPRGRLIFVGDSIRGDIGSSLVAKEKDPEISGEGILVLKDRDALEKIKKQISENPDLKLLVDSMNVNGFVVEDVPLNEKGEPVLFSKSSDKFLEKL